MNLSSAEQITHLFSLSGTMNLIAISEDILRSKYFAVCLFWTHITLYTVQEWIRANATDALASVQNSASTIFVVGS